MFIFFFSVDQKGVVVVVGEERLTAGDLRSWTERLAALVGDEGRH